MQFEAKKNPRAIRATLLLGAALGLGLPAISLADATDSATTTTVKVADLNLSTTNGQRKLEKRTASAIEAVCPSRGSAASSRSASNAEYRECAQSVRADVKQQLDERGSRAMAGR